MGEWGVTVPRVMGARTISFVATCHVADFGQVEVDVAVFVVGEEGVEGIGVVVFGESGRFGNVHFVGFLVDSQHAVEIDFGCIEHVAEFVGNDVF